jgi:FkbM family methyltransferase
VSTLLLDYGLVVRVRLARSVLHRLGIEAVRYSPANFAHLRLVDVLTSGNVDILIDGGANDGKWAMQRRADGFRARIVSVEPQAESFAALQTRAAGDPQWSVVHAAIGASDGETTLYVDSDPTSSSLFGSDRDPRPTESVPLFRLDTICADVVGPGDEVFVKLDLEGNELEAVRGAERTLRQAVGLMVELELQPVEGAARIESVIGELRTGGFVMVAFEPNKRDSTGNVVLANGLFLRP